MNELKKTILDALRILNPHGRDPQADGDAPQASDDRATSRPQTPYNCDNPAASKR